MAIAINGSVVSSLMAQSSTSTTISFTVAAGLTNSILIVTWQSGVTLATSVTWNGTGLTMGTAFTAVNDYSRYFYLVNPAAGTYNIVVSHGSHASTRGGISIMTLTGVNTTAPINIDGSTGSTSSSPSLSVSSSIDSCFLIDWLANYKNGGTSPNVTQGSGQTEVVNMLASNSDERYTVSWKNGGAAGDQTMSASLSLSAPFEIAIIAITPYNPYAFKSKALSETTLINDANLQAYWKLENVNDSKNSYTLTNSGMQFVASDFGNGASTAGTTSRYLTIANTMGTTPDGNTSILIRVKLLTEFSGADKSDRFVLLGWTSTDTDLWIGYARISGVNYLQFGMDRNGTDTQLFSYAINLGTTEHDLIITESSRVIKGYCDGRYLGTVTGASGSGGSNLPDHLRFLQWNNVLDVTFDDSAVFDRVLTDKECAYISGKFFSTTGDGYAGQQTVGGYSWATIRAGAGNDSDATSAFRYCGLESTNSSPNFVLLRKAGFYFDTSSIPAGAVITSAVLKVYTDTPQDTFGSSVGMGVVAWAPASGTIANGDYDSFGYTRLADTDIVCGSLANGGYNSWTLNATALALINKGGTTYFGLTVSSDIDNSAPAWASLKDAGANIFFTEQTIGDKDAYIEVTYTPAPPYNASFLFLMV